MRKRSKYRPRPVNVLAHVQTVANMAGMDLDVKLECSLDLNDVYLRLAQAQASEQDWRTVFDAVNILEQLATWRHVRDPLGVVKAAQEVCARVMERTNNTGVRTLYAAELQAISAVIALWMDEMPRVPKGVAAQAAARVNMMTQQALSGNAPKGARLVEPPRAA
jgi:hypothetical protein